MRMLWGWLSPHFPTGKGITGSTHQEALDSLPSDWGGLDKVEAIGHPPSPVDIIWQDPCWAYPTKPTPSRWAGPGLYGIII